MTNKNDIIETARFFGLQDVIKKINDFEKGQEIHIEFTDFYIEAKKELSAKESIFQRIKLTKDKLKERIVGRRED